MWLVGKAISSLPFSRTLVTRSSSFTLVSIHGPIGLNVSVFFARHSVRSLFCQVRSLTSLPIV